jgi:hypothetical protein
MTRSALEEIYFKREKEFQSTLANTTRRINRISNLRLLVALLCLAGTYFSFHSTIAIAATVLLIGVFFYLVQWHAQLFREKTHLENLVRINKNELKALSGDFSVFDPGGEFIDPHHPYSHDLDIFGDDSLFQYINRCNTIRGKRKLASWLDEPVLEAERIVTQQQCVQDLQPRIDFRQHVQAAGMEAGEQAQDHDQLTHWTIQPPLFSNPKALGVMLWIIPSLTAISLVLTFIFPLAKLALMSLIIIQWIITGMHLKKVSAYHDSISRKKNILEKYSRLLLHVEKEKFQAEKLVALSRQANDAHIRINKLASLVSALDARNNSMTALVVNSLLLYDLQCAYRLEKWKEDNSKDLPRWLDTITEIEALNSFGTFAFNNPSFTYATISTELKIEAREMAHPLIADNERVVNPIEIGPRSSVMIITGANMAGKSTYLRTVGVNLVLALNGAPVCATYFSCPLRQMRSGMRTADSLKDHQSYFYAELNRLKNIMEELRNDKPLLILLDEILKGTNSNDKQAGSIALVKQLLPHPCLALIATHDLALGELEKQFPGQITNYCFEANIENDQLSFDYMLKRGVAQKMNASFLMKKMGIIP